LNALSLLPFAGAAAALLLALAVSAQARRSRTRWIFVAGMLALAVEAGCSGLAALAPTAGTGTVWHNARLLAMSLVPGLWLAFSRDYGRGETSAAPWSSYLFPIAGMLLPAAVAAGFQAGLVWPSPGRVGPAGHLPYALGPAGTVVLFLVLAMSGLVLMNLEQTYRRSAGVLRWRVKFMLFGLGALFTVRILTATQALLFRGVSPTLAAADAAALLVAAALILRSLLRRDHFATNVYLSQSALRHSLAFLLVGLYLFGVGLVAQVAHQLDGDVRTALTAFVLPVALVGLALLLQSDRLRAGLRRFVSRHFHRPDFDYQVVWRRFTRATAACAEQPELCRALAGFLAETLDALSVTIWLLDPGRQALTCAASTSVSGSLGRTLGLAPEDLRRLLAFHRGHPEPVDLAGRPEAWARALREAPASPFVPAAPGVGVPLVVRGELLGLVTVSDRIGGNRFGPAEFDLLKCVADHSAAALLSVQLAQRLRETTQLAAFQTMAAFFVHDLKNAASTLNLMVQNLQIHFDNPAFRSDALRGLTKTMGHMNQLVQRLGSLRHELKVQPVRGDLNAVVAATLGRCDQAGPAIGREFRPLPPVRIDAEQLDKVVLNLVRNATEAAGPAGRVQVATMAHADSVVLAVSDDGCGMTPEFVAESLFHPFRTTKNHGLGIGMFQAKMIVETHGGWIVVRSTRGQGTTIEVHLPAGESGPVSAPAAVVPSHLSTSGAA
jgi:putative PEP-CTERM system histidine kinase